MNRKDRIEKVFEHLKSIGATHTKKEFAALIGANYTNVTSAFKGNDLYLTSGLFDKIEVAFPQINADWLLTGEGEMLKSSASKFRDDKEVVIGSYINNIFSMSTDQEIHDMVADKFAKHLVEMYEQGRVYPAQYVKQMQEQYEKQLAEAQKRIAELIEAIK